jgi:hypothetical protein
MIERQVLEQAAPSTQPIDWQEPTKTMALLPGVYKNETTIEIVLRDDKLMVLSSSGSDPAQIMQGNMQFCLFIDDGAGSRRNVMTFTIESKRDGKFRHLRLGSRVWLRTESLDNENNKRIENRRR